MVVYSLVYLVLKVIDFSEQGQRLQTYRESAQFREAHEQFQSLYYELNYQSISLAVMVVAATVYIKVSLVQTKIFNSTTFKKFMWLCFIAIVLYILLLFYFVYQMFNLTGLNIISIIEGIKAISYLTSDSSSRNVCEYLFSFLLFVGLYALLVLSNLIEDEIVRLDMLRAKSNNENSKFISQMEMF